MIDYLKTRTGLLYWERPQDYRFTVEEIAESLARQCRFNGHLGWESVAVHSVRVARRLEHMPPPVRLAALLHDAHEAYTGDVPGPLLRAGLAGPLVAIGHAIQREILRQLAPQCASLAVEEHAAIHDADATDCAFTLAHGAGSDRRIREDRNLYVRLYRELAVLPSGNGSAQKTDTDD